MKPVTVGSLIPLNSAREEDLLAPKIPVSFGSSTVGRDVLPFADKRVSRKHLSLVARGDGSVEVTVEGPNPVTIESSQKTRKLRPQNKAVIVDGDIIQLIPGQHIYKYKTSSAELEAVSCGGCCPVESNDNNESSGLILKRKHEVIEDKSQEITLQQMHATNSSLGGVSSKKTVVSANKAQMSIESVSCENIDDKSCSFQLLQVQGLPAWANSSAVTLDDVFQGDILVAILSNYMVDINWLLSASPLLRKVPHVLVIHGESDGTLEHMKKSKPANWILHKPPLPISYGTHHSKAMFLIYERGVRVVVHTANLIYVDWNNKTQGLWMQDFPWKDQDSHLEKSAFEEDLVEYLERLKWPTMNITLPVVGKALLSPSLFRRIDYSSAKVRLVASVPGYHTGLNLKKWGHMKLRSVLQNCLFDKEFQGSPLIYQFSSLGSLDEKWMEELVQSMSSGKADDQTLLGKGRVQIIWPTVEDVRDSLEGYAAGNALPSPQKNVDKVFLKRYWSRWKADHTGRGRAMPHIKSYARYNGQKLA